jgi:sugar phosphate isomerase/epimerase
MRPTISTSAFAHQLATGGLDLDAFAALCRELGLDAVELDAAQLAASGLSLPEACAVLAAAGLTVVALTAQIDAERPPYMAEREIGGEVLIWGQACWEAGVPLLVTQLTYRDHEPAEGMEWKLAWQRATAGFRTAALGCQRWGVRLAISNGSALTRTIADTAALCAEATPRGADPREVGICIEADRLGGEEVGGVVGRVMHCHLATPTPAALPAPLLRTLAASGYDGYASITKPGSAEAMRSLAEVLRGR